MHIGPLTVIQAARCEVCGENTPADGAHCIGCGAALPPAAGAYTGATQPLDPEELRDLDAPNDQASRIARAIGVPRLLLVSGVIGLVAAVTLSSLRALLAGLDPAAVFESIRVSLGG